MNYLKLMRLHQPVGIYLLLLPCLWSLALSKNLSNVKLLFIFIMGSILTRSFGCIINDIIDIDIDKHVERTKDRPLTSKKITLKHAYFLLFPLMLTALILFFQLNFISKIIAVIAVILTVIYPFMKRITYFPQVILGITFNLGVLMADAMVNDHITIHGLCLYIAAIFWTLGYDTIYAFQDYKYDKKIGTKSTAIKFESRPKFWISIFYIMMLIFLMLAGYFADLSLLSQIGIIASIAEFIYRISKLNINDSEDCKRKFKENTILGIFILITIV